MDPIILQDKFISLLPINGDMCKDILKQIDSDYKENDIYFDQCTKLIELLNEKQLKL